MKVTLISHNDWLFPPDDLSTAMPGVIIITRSGPQNPDIVNTGIQFLIRIIDVIIRIITTTYVQRLTLRIKQIYISRPSDVDSFPFCHFYLIPSLIIMARQLDDRKLPSWKQSYCSTAFKISFSDIFVIRVFEC